MYFYTMENKRESIIFITDSNYFFFGDKSLTLLLTSEDQDMGQIPVKTYGNSSFIACWGSRQICFFFLSKPSVDLLLHLLIAEFLQ